MSTHRLQRGSVVAFVLLASLPLFVSADACPTLTRSLSIGAKGDDVLQLQKFLVNEGELFSDGVTGSFGLLTQKAVGSWQSARRIASSRDPNSGWGNVGPKTRAAINAQCSSASSNTGGSWATNGPIAPIKTAATSSAKGALSIVQCPAVSPPASLCVTSWRAIRSANGCVGPWYCVVVTSSIRVSTSSPLVTTSVTSTSTSLGTTTSSSASSTTVAGTATSTSTGAATSTSGVPTSGFGLFTNWCPNSSDGLGYWSQAPCNSGVSQNNWQSGGGNPFGSSSATAQEGAICAPEDRQDFVACPHMANCMGGGTYLICRNSIWTRF